MVSFKTMVKAGEHTPDRFVEYEHKSLYDIADQDVFVLDYEMFTSSNVQKYNNDNTEGVIILVEDMDGNKCTVVTHAKTIVRAFKSLAKRGVGNMYDLDKEIIQFHLGEVVVNGNKYPQWQIV